MKEILIEIWGGGKTKITTSGFKGNACKEATKNLQEALGTVVSDTNTAEMFEQPDELKVNE